MTRVVNATLTAALAAGTGKPFLAVSTGDVDGNVYASATPIAYKLTGTELEVTAPLPDTFGDVAEKYVWLARGLTINGVSYYVNTSRFAIHRQVYSPHGLQTITARLFPKQYYSAAGDLTYNQVITAFCTAFGKTAVFKDGAAAWLSYQFLPDGKQIIMNDANSFLAMLQQKYLIFAADGGSEQVLFYALNSLAVPAADFSFAPTADFSIGYNNIRNRLFMWRDEVGTVHSDGTATDPIHNLGYLESTAACPARHNPDFELEVTTRPDLRIADGDSIELSVPGGNTYQVFALVSEEFTQASKSHPHPRWSMTIRSNQVFENTAGGALPSTIERVSNYTPLNTSMFDGIMTEDQNNLQAAMDKIDNYTIERVYPWIKVFDNIDGWTAGHTGTGYFTPAWPTATLGTGITSASVGLIRSTNAIGIYKSIPSYHQRFKLRIYSGVLINASCVIWLGMLATPATPSNTQNHFGFRISSGAIYASCGDGTTGQAVDTGITLTQNVARQLEARFYGTEIRYYVDGVLKATITQNLPDAVGLYATLYVTNSTTLDKSLLVYPLVFILGPQQQNLRLTTIC